MIAIGLFVGLTPGLAFASSNYQKDYCDKEEYVGNPGGKYPHLHCTKDVFTLSRSATDHINFHDRPNCNKLNDVLADPGGNYASAGNAAAITNVINPKRNASAPSPF